MTLAHDQLSHLQSLEAESIDIIREVAASFPRPVLLYSTGNGGQCWTYTGALQAATVTGDFLHTLAL